MNRYSYKNLNVYQDAKAFVVAVYKLLEQFPDIERFALCSQIRRAIVSIPSNIADGMGRVSSKDQAHFLSIYFHQGTICNVQLDIAHDLKYIDSEMFNQGGKRCGRNQQNDFYDGFVKKHIPRLSPLTFSLKKCVHFF